MPSQRLIFTALPAGVTADGRDMLVNLHVSPRLTVTGGGEAPLAEWPAIADLAKTMNDAQIVVVIDGEAFPAERVVQADPALWAALFPLDTPVRTRKVEDFTGKELLTYPLAALAGAIEGDYLAMAAAGPDLPAFGKLRGRVDYTPEPGVDLRRALDLLAKTGADARIKSKRTAVALLAVYHRPLNAVETVSVVKQGDNDPHEPTKYRTHKRVKLPTLEELAKALDFHGRFSAVGQHAALMRQCGLVIPLRVRGGGRVPKGEHVLSVKVRWGRGRVTTQPDVLPQSRIKRTGSGVVMAAATSLIVDGWLKASAEPFSLVALDVDGAGIALKNMAASRIGPDDERYDDADDPESRTPKPLLAGAPRLRTAGLQLAYDRRDRALGALFQRSQAMEQALADGQPIILTAEDVTRGWRVEIASGGGPWRSVMRFDGRYRLMETGVTIDTQDEETMIRLSTGGSADGNAPNVLKLTEAMFAWAGWSLAAPEPGKAIMPDDTTLAEGPNDVPPGLPLHASFRATPKSLPSLRFGRTYKVRMRLADVAGGGLDHDPAARAPAGAETSAVTFGRYEPVESPALALLKGSPDLADGESMGRAALRKMDDPARTIKTVHRLIAPPRVAIRFAELHGSLDSSDGRPRADLYALLAERDKHFPVRAVTTKAWQPGQLSADPPQGDDVVVEFAVAEPGKPAPYLPDPLAGGVALKIADVPGIDPEKLYFVPFYGDEWDASAVLNWPDAKVFAIRCSTTGSVGWDRVKRQFNIPLPPSERARIRISALLPKLAFEQMRLLRRLRETDPTAFNRQMKAINDGQHWMFTPWRKLELVHATQRPLVTPKFLHISASRAAGQARAHIGLGTPVHAKSTLRNDIDAAWQEIDDNGGDGPRTLALSSPAFTIDFHRSALPDGLLKDGKGAHMLSDTRARRIGYRMVATSRFREYMPFDIRSDATRLSVESPRASVWVPSSSPPPAPAIRYIVPTFGWRTSHDGKRLWRSGGGLRVWLDRPWFGSGANEMLAVLLPRGTDDPQLSDAKNYVSQWGADPVWRGRNIASIAPPRSAFSRAVNAGPVPVLFAPPTGNPDPAVDGQNPPAFYPIESLLPQGAPAGLRVDAVPHAVGYDSDRQLWYCDIVINPGESYFPFVRLALARYQPASLPDMHLSSVAMASFQQLAPDRVATVIPIGTSRVRVEVRGHGDPPRDGEPLTFSPVPTTGRVDIRLQRLKAGQDESLDWQDTAEGARPEVPNPTEDRPRVQSKAGSARMSTRMQTRIATARRQLEAGDFSVFDTDPSIIDLLLPPLLLDQVVQLPRHGPDRLRILVTEREEHLLIDDDGRSTDKRATRIVYTAAIEV